MKPVITEKYLADFRSIPVREYTLTNSNGMQVSVINYGAVITKMITADKSGNMKNVTAGFDTLDEYIKNGNQYLGAIVGRYCNRIADAKFSLDGREYKLAENNNGNSLHGGNAGFDKVCWHVEDTGNDFVKLYYMSKDGEENFPGNLKVEVVYTLTDDNEIIIDYTAKTDKATPANFTSHCYFNLSGEIKNVLDHELKIFAAKFTNLNTNSIPTGELLPVKNDRLDFSNTKKVGQDINSFPGGYDINFVLDKLSAKAAELYDPSTGRFMEMFTTEPGLQLYVGDSNNNKYSTLCLEAQHFPDSPNHASFPNTILRPGEIYRQKTSYRFSVK